MRLLQKFHRPPAARAETLVEAPQQPRRTPNDGNDEHAGRGTRCREERAKQAFRTADGWLTRTAIVSRTIYWGIHAACLLVFWVGAPGEAVALCAATYAVRVFGITGGYHRYFAHKTYKTSRVFQFVLAFLGCSATQKGPLWWAARTAGTTATPTARATRTRRREGFWYSHQGWVFDALGRHADRADPRLRALPGAASG